MKHILLLLIAISLISCSSTKTVRDSKKVIKGSWTLNAITYNETGTYKISLLNDASKACFEGSTWNFIPNNNSGTYTINKDNCSSGEQYFIFTIDEVNSETGLYDFLLKPTNERHKSETNQGFRFKLSTLSETTMQWQQTVTVDGSPFTYTINFTKI